MLRRWAIGMRNRLLNALLDALGAAERKVDATRHAGTPPADRNDPLLRSYEQAVARAHAAQHHAWPSRGGQS